MRFEWDESKAERNRQKHGVTFSEISTVFGDPLHYRVPDPDHSRDEDRWITMGTSERGRLLIVSHTYRGRGEEIVNRIVNGRKVTSEERDFYEKRLLEYLRGEGDTGRR